MDMKRLREKLVLHVREAGSNALAKQREIRIEDKGNRDIVTAVDKENGARIRRELLDLEPQISFLGEDTEEYKGSRNVLVVVDPLDATVNYSMGMKQFSIMAAVLEADVPVFGVIYLPAFDEMITAEKGNGAWLNDGIKKTRLTVSQVDDLAKAIVSCNRSNYPDEQSMQTTLDIITGLMQGTRTWRNSGTAGYEYAQLARGELHGIVTPLAEGVHIAGYLIMEEAGARVTDNYGNPYGLKSERIVAAHPDIQPKLLKLVEDHITAGAFQNFLASMPAGEEDDIRSCF